MGEDVQFASLNVHVLFQHTALLERELLNKGITGQRIRTTTHNSAEIAQILQNSDYVSRQEGTLDVKKLRMHLLALTESNTDTYENKLSARQELLEKIFTARGKQRKVKKVCFAF